MSQTIKFRAWDKATKGMFYLGDAYGYDFIFGKTGNGLYFDGILRMDLNETNLMMFTGLCDKHELKEIYEGDIISPEGRLKGNVYESPQVYEEGIDCLIEGMGTKTWRDTESIAMGFGCKYAE